MLKKNFFKHVNAFEKQKSCYYFECGFSVFFEFVIYLFVKLNGILILNNIITEAKFSDEEKIELARLSVLLNALSFYNGAVYWNEHDYKEITGMWLQKNLLGIQN